MGYRSILWDFDGTLCDSHSAVRHCMEAIFLGEDSSVEGSERISRIIARGSPLEEVIQELAGREIQEEEGAELIARYRELYRIEGRQRERLFPGVNDMLRQLHEMGRQQVVVTNKKQSLVEEALRGFEIDHFFSGVFGAAAGLPTKPDAALFHEVIRPKLTITESSSIEANFRIVMVGDSQVDVRFAKNCGIDACFLTYGLGIYQSDGEEPEHTVGSVAQLFELLAR